MTSLHRLFVAILATICLLVEIASVAAETVNLPGGKTVVVPDGAPPEVRKKMMEDAMKQNRESHGEPGGSKPEESKKGEPESKGESKEESKDEAATVKRPESPKQEPNSDELEAMPEAGQIVLEFQGHSWPAMIQWYSRATGREIEWQELPSGFINLRTQRPFTMRETGDLLNRLLLARGFTILDDGEFMQVVKVEGLNPAFVPRVLPQQLATRGLHSFVRVSFPLKRFKADELVKELEAMKSKHGTMVAMTAANRIEAMDTVRNLRDIFATIDVEENSGERAPREFEIQHLRAADVKKKLDEMFGSVGPVAPPLTPEQIQQMQQMQRANRGNPQQPQQPNAAANKPENPNVIVNELRNSVIVRAEPHLMIDIAAAVELLDVPVTRDRLDIKAYTLATRSPQELSGILSESGAISPTAIVRVDKNAKALLVSGTQFDHYKIEELIKKIDGNPRRFESIRLRRYPARQVATTIQDMMGKPKEEDNNRRRRYSYWDSWSNNDEEENPADAFRVAADVENNRLILKCNDAEYEMVIDLLAQMGEVMTRSEFAANQVVLDGVDPEDELLERVRKIFNASSKNEVILPSPAPRPVEVDLERDQEDTDDSEDTDDPEAHDPAKSVSGETTTTRPFKGTGKSYFLAQAAEPTEDLLQPLRQPQQQAPPVIVRRNAQGKLVVQCDDPVALEKFEELLRQMAPPPQDWVFFKLKHVTALWMKFQLEEFFEEDVDNNPGFFFWDWGRDNDEEPSGLGDEKKMRFIDDGETTLVVRNASARQLATVRELIKLYDVAEPPNEQTARFKKIIQIQHSKASVIETTLKDAFRDLLSSNDKAFAQQRQGGESDGRSRRMGPFSLSESTTSALQGTSFKGKISFGSDDTTNTLLVTAEGQKLLDIVVEMVAELDQAAQASDGARVVSIPAGLSSGNLRDSLTRLFGPESVTTKPQPGQENAPPNPGEQPPGGNNPQQIRGQR